MANGGNNAVKDNQLAKTPSDPWREIIRISKRVEKAKKPDPQDMQRLRQLAVQTPGFLSACSTTASIRQQLIEKISHGNSRAFMLAEMDVLKKQLDFDAAPPLERLLIDHILTVRLRLIHAEHRYNECVVNQPFTFQVAEFRDNLLSSTQARFIRAIEALARVRRLARNTPALQINIAHEGGKQVNVQGDVNGQKAAPAPEPATGNG
jgi:hypothetical protein